MSLLTSLPILLWAPVLFSFSFYALFINLSLLVMINNLYLYMFWWPSDPVCSVKLFDFHILSSMTHHFHGRTVITLSSLLSSCYKNWNKSVLIPAIKEIETNFDIDFCNQWLEHVDTVVKEVCVISQNNFGFICCLSKSSKEKATWMSPLFNFIKNVIHLKRNLDLVTCMFVDLCLVSM